MDDPGVNVADLEGLFSKRSSSNILSDPRILEHLRIVAEEAQSSDINDDDAESEMAANKRELADKIANYNKRNQLGAFRLSMKEVCKVFSDKSLLMFSCFVSCLIV